MRQHWTTRFMRVLFGVLCWFIFFGVIGWALML